jgi:hypothetical protein
VVEGAGQWRESFGPVKLLIVDKVATMSKAISQ